MNDEWNLPTRRPTLPEDIERAIENGQRLSRSEFRATHAVYDREQDRLEITLVGGVTLAIPRSQIPCLSGLEMLDTVNVQTWPDGSILEIPEYDVHISVHGMVSRLLRGIRTQRSYRVSRYDSGFPWPGYRGS